jgi:hypothetical protein
LNNQERAGRRDQPGKRRRRPESAQGERDRRDYDGARIAHHAELVVVSTTAITEITSEGQMLVLMNQREIGARRGLIVSRDAATGRTHQHQAARPTARAARPRPRPRRQRAVLNLLGAAKQQNDPFWRGSSGPIDRGTPAEADLARRVPAHPLPSVT